MLLMGDTFTLDKKTQIKGQTITEEGKF